MSGVAVAPSGALPVESTSFVGRRNDLAEARTQLATTRLLTVTGPGGVGKTRFAVQLAQTVSRVYRDGLWFIELDSLPGDSNADSVAAAVASALFVAWGQSRPADAVAAAIGSNEVLLVFDNCEHVLPAIRGLIVEILDRCAGAKILATSREPLNVSGESVRPLTPLDHASTETTGDRKSEAVALFIDRARAIVPAFDPKGPELTTVASICESLEGIPLAIELAAVRQRILSPSQILERLRRPLDLLSGRSTDAPTRHRTLRSSIEWSYELCTPQERWLWRRLSVFAGGWDLAEAEAVADPVVIAQSEVLDVLQSLVEKSIVVVHDDGDEFWYSLLTSIRQFGSDMLDASGERDAALGALLSATVARLYQVEAEWIGPRQDHWLRLYFRAAATIRAAIEISLAGEQSERALQLTLIGWRVSWQAVGRVDEHRAWLTRVLAHTSEPTPLRAQALVLSAAHAAAQGEHDRARERMQEAEDVANRLHDPLLQTIVNGVGAEFLPDTEQTLAMRAAMAGLERVRPDLSARYYSRIRLALQYQRMGDIELASKARQEILDDSTRTGERYESSYLMLHSGRLAALSGEPASAIDRTRIALQYKIGLTNPGGVAQALEVLSFAFAEQGDAEQAATLLGAARTYWRVTGAFPIGDATLLAIRTTPDRTARAILGDARFALFYDRGRRLSADQAIDLALGTEAGGETRVRAPHQSSPSEPPDPPRDLPQRQSHRRDRRCRRGNFRSPRWSPTAAATSRSQLHC
ncbi:ATP-binding protein [Leifsonia poae]|uniref:ATP-binding protein n=1 Tax=Leifsonia poae TaxID=110933 RepID=UPI003D67AC58